MANQEFDNLKGKYRRVFNTDDGKAVLEDLKRFCGFENSSVGIEFDNNRTNFNEGKRKVYLMINNMLKGKNDNARS